MGSNIYIYREIYTGLNTYVTYVGITYVGIISDSDGEMATRWRRRRRLGYLRRVKRWLWWHGVGMGVVAWWHGAPDRNRIKDTHVNRCGVMGYGLHTMGLTFIGPCAIFDPSAHIAHQLDQLKESVK